VQEECEEVCGPVERVQVKDAQPPHQPEVQVWVQFRYIDDAKKAAILFQGRLFGIGVSQLGSLVINPQSEQPTLFTTAGCVLLELLRRYISFFSTYQKNTLFQSIPSHLASVTTESNIKCEIFLFKTNVCSCYTSWDTCMPSNCRWAPKRQRFIEGSNTVQILNPSASFRQLRSSSVLPVYATCANLGSVTPSYVL
jgi:hypothetical protein